ncbi:hypothetical protein F0562_024730 [Nyssa sinensis]|uniref:Uncharacterized protein n=1 Tax=Nyssa sinensis TaxID=561372 RepID=A0A5J5BGT4_9ASTE|nr:hypothetical protein F0562_024730 [Nyssa sinensis]
MPKNDFKAKSSRKPLRDVSNGVNPPKSVKKKATEKEDRVGDDAQDRILLVLSALIHQIDELVAQALKLKVTSEKGRKEIDSFAHVLSEMQTSLKVDALVDSVIMSHSCHLHIAYVYILSQVQPWVSKFQRAHSIACKGSENQLEQPLADKTVPALNDSISNVVDSPDQNNLDSLVSPSPLVSWRVDCTTESSRQLFLLTPLPRPKGFSSRLQGSYISVPENITLNGTVGVASLLAIFGDMSDDLLEGVAIKPTPSKPPDSGITKMESTVEHGFVSPPKVCKRECSMLVMTPCLKIVTTQVLCIA